MPARIAVLADIHANVWALAAVLEHASRQDVSSIWNLGDIFMALSIRARLTNFSTDTRSLRDSHRRVARLEHCISQSRLRLERRFTKSRRVRPSRLGARSQPAEPRRPPNILCF